MSMSRASPELSLPAFGWFAIASVLSVPLAFLQQPANLGVLFLLGSSITFISGLIAWGLWLLSRTRRSSLTMFAAQVLLIGLVRGAAFSALTPMFGLTEPASVGFRLTNSILITAIWLTLACVVVSGQRRYLGTYRTLVNQAVFTAAQRDGGSGKRAASMADTTDLDAVENIAALKANLSATHSLIAESGISEESLTRAAASVRQEIEVTLRPMSHRLWFNATLGLPQVRVWGLITDALATLRFSIPRVLIICILPTFVGGLAFLPIAVNLLTIGFSTFSLSVMLGVFALAQRRKAGSSALGNAAFLFLAGVVTYAMTYCGLIITGFSSATETFSGMAWVIPLAVWIVVWADSAIILVSRDRRTITSALESRGLISWSTPHTEQERLASYLHNSLQSELTGIAYQLEHSAQTLDTAESRRSLEQLGSLISRSISQDFANFSESPLTRISRIMEAWSGIAEVSIRLDHSVSEGDPRLVMAVQVIEEGITNAVRHSGASEISAVVSTQGENLQIALSSNQPAQVNLGSGMGTAWLARYAIETHQLTNKNGRSVLAVTL
mgnify:CR=1 FL=1